MNALIAEARPTARVEGHVRRLFSSPALWHVRGSFTGSKSHSALRENALNSVAFGNSGGRFIRRFAPGNSSAGSPASMCET